MRNKFLLVAIFFIFAVNSYSDVQIHTEECYTLVISEFNDIRIIEHFNSEGVLTGVIIWKLKNGSPVEKKLQLGHFEHSIGDNKLDSDIIFRQELSQKLQTIKIHDDRVILKSTNNFGKLLIIDTSGKILMEEDYKSNYQLNLTEFKNKSIIIINCTNNSIENYKIHPGE